MSKDDYARVFIHAPTRTIAMVVAIVGGGTGLQYVFGDSQAIRAARHATADCQTELADIRAIATEHERDLDAVTRWAEGAVNALGSVQRMEALHRAPRAYTDARGAVVSR